MRCDLLEPEKEVLHERAKNLPANHGIIKRGKRKRIHLLKK